MTRTPVRASMQRLGDNGLTQHPLEGRPPNDQRREIGVARLWIAVVGDRRHRGAPRVEERLEHVGEPLAQLDHDPSEEAVGLVDLWGATALGRERRLGVSGDVERIGLEQHHRVPGPPERERGCQSPDPASDHNDVLRHR